MTAFNSGDGPAASSPHSAGRDELGYRLRQQSLLGEFGRAAMQTRDLRIILQKATELCAIGLQAQFAKVLEYETNEECLMVRAGVGWKENTIDVVSLAADVGSPAGYAYRTGESVISNHLEAETRFRTPQLLTDHGVRRAINVLIEKGAEGKAYFGVLEVDSADAGQFDQADADFLTGFAGLLGIAIERQQADAKLQEALKYQALLTREMSHRVKNSLASVVGLLRVQARNTPSQEVKSALEDASLRVSTIADVHDHLWRSSHVGFVELADFMTELCKKLRGNVGKHTLNCQSDALLLSADHAVPLGLLINELVANAIKYAYPDSRGLIEVSAREIEGSLRVEVSDQGKGLPEGFDIDEPRASLGFKVITGMVRQLQGHLTIAKDWKGSRFLIDLPIISHPDRSQSS
ncbi:GAF domain-containing protein [Bradyrhizobium sp. 38]|uniref:sensor histidine kinase n=1 Tax=unclassified Bradyrhizobium TaxID=2631580 RepID=UPI001FF8974C|nr:MULTISPECIES: histidine kinase dimerization/phosphoacceptor domain -containing protein [unclassified Bradyrhizobium]MCK1339805.1 GAF domain-containing protein [Bradyrhizobium sp. 38]MCK1782736.1 GAF domain-containing protein [Bradyrhizobium sp. 132]